MCHPCLFTSGPADRFGGPLYQLHQCAHTDLSLSRFAAVVMTVKLPLVWHTQLPMESAMGDPLYNQGSAESLSWWCWRAGASSGLPSLLRTLFLTYPKRKVHRSGRPSAL